jgi:hypothetical protein
VTEPSLSGLNSRRQALDITISVCNRRLEWYMVLFIRPANNTADTGDKNLTAPIELTTQAIEPRRTSNSTHSVGRKGRTCRTCRPGQTGRGWLGLSGRTNMPNKSDKVEQVIFVKQGRSVVTGPHYVSNKSEIERIRSTCSICSNLSLSVFDLFDPDIWSFNLFVPLVRSDLLDGRLSIREWNIRPIRPQCLTISACSTSTA